MISINRFFPFTPLVLIFRVGVVEITAETRNLRIEFFDRSTANNSLFGFYFLFVSFVVSFAIVHHRRSIYTCLSSKNPHDECHSIDSRRIKSAGQDLKRQPFEPRPSRRYLGRNEDTEIRKRKRIGEARQQMRMRASCCTRSRMREAVALYRGIENTMVVLHFPRSCCTGFGRCIMKKNKLTNEERKGEGIRGGGGAGGAGGAGVEEKKEEEQE